MATTNGTRMAQLLASPQNLPDVRHVGARIRMFNENVLMNSQAAGDDIRIARLPVGAVPYVGIINASATLGASATLAIGIAGSTGKYRTAAVFTNANTPTLFGNAAAMGEVNTTEETVLGTVAVAALPSSGNFRVMMLYGLD